MSSLHGLNQVHVSFVQLTAVTFSFYRWEQKIYIHMSCWTRLLLTSRSIYFLCQVRGQQLGLSQKKQVKNVISFFKTCHSKCLFLWITTFHKNTFLKRYVCIFVVISVALKSWINWLNRRGWVAYICFCKLDHHWFRYWLVACSAPTSAKCHLNQCWFISRPQCVNALRPEILKKMYLNSNFNEVCPWGFNGQ